ncbi:hypothetical protein Q3G72_027581 [Acer saccharum]|nr:hypothetical protein Q3G72_027581 [Acer saccharum]
MMGLGHTQLYMQRDGSGAVCPRPVSGAVAVEFRVFDVDTQFHNVDVKILKLDEQQFLGEATCILSEIVTKSNRSLTLDLVCREESIPSTHPQHRGKLIVHAEECINSKTATEMTLRKVQKSLADLEKLHSSQQGEHMFLPTAIGHNYQSKVVFI